MSATFSDAVLALAEDLNTHLPLSIGLERIVTPRHVVWLGPSDDPHHTVVQRLRLAPEEVEAAVGEVRQLLAARGRRRSTWEVGRMAEPADLGERLVALGMAPDEPEPLAVGMVLARPPEAGRSEVEARPVASVEEYRESSRILRACFGGGAPPDEAAERSFAAMQDEGVSVRYLAWRDGVPVATAEAIFTEAAVVLGGGATLPEARGHGSYRALVAARWEAAAARGTPALVVQAGRMSRPILARLGFVEVTEVRIFLDVF